jgi:hypothetical protein
MFKIFNIINREHIKHIFRINSKPILIKYKKVKSLIELKCKTKRLKDITVFKKIIISYFQEWRKLKIKNLVI